MKDDPHDNILPPDRDNWCYTCNQHYETCHCDRSLPDGAGIIIGVVTSLCILCVIGFGMWLL